MNNTYCGTLLNNNRDILNRTVSLRKQLQAIVLAYAQR